jgi:hypothetical protein
MDALFSASYPHNYPRDTMKPTFVALIAALTLPALASAQPVPDHLKCYKIKDSRAKASYTADLGGLVSEPGCLIKVPGTMLCVEATKANVNPPPPGGTDNSGPAGRFLCYKVKCPKAVLTPLTWHDQFGTGTVTPSVPKMLCAPEILATTTSTTAAPTTTTTTLMQGCTPTTCAALGINCGPAGDGCGGLLQCGSCPSGQICGGGGTPSVCG